MTSKQKNTLVGMILGDAYLQKTGKRNARIRLEHSRKQKEYLEWKISLLPQYFSKKVQAVTRLNPIWGKRYSYVRAQSTSSPEFGKLHELFYRNSEKIIPKTIGCIFKDPFSLAIWFMDDGYYYPRDKMSYLYTPNYSEESTDTLLLALKENFGLLPIVKRKKRGSVLIFNVIETKKLMLLIKIFITPSMSYKMPLDPVSTEQNSPPKI